MGQESGARVLIIGGSGFVSGTIARTAVAEGNRVTVVTRGQRDLPDGVDGIVADRQDREGCARHRRGRWRPGTSSWTASATRPTTPARTSSCSASARRASSSSPPTSSSTRPTATSRSRTREPLPHRRLLRRQEAPLRGGACSRRDTGDMRWTVFRPCHIYGPGSQLGCLPRHGRDPELHRPHARRRAAATGGRRLLPAAAHLRARPGRVRPQRPRQRQLLRPDLQHVRPGHHRVPLLLRVVADFLGVPLKIVELPVDRYREEHPEDLSFLTHRICEPGQDARSRPQGARHAHRAGAARAVRRPGGGRALGGEAWGVGEGAQRSSSAPSAMMKIVDCSSTLAAGPLRLGCACVSRTELHGAKPLRRLGKGGIRVPCSQPAPTSLKRGSVRSWWSGCPTPRCGFSIPII